MSDHHESGKKWSCEYCTYLNFPAAKKCTLCKGPRPPQLITEDAVRPEQDIYKVASLATSDADNTNSRPNLSLNTSSANDPTRKWPCHMCTYLNWPRTARCSQCMTPRRKFSPPASTSRDKRSPLSVNVNICEGQGAPVAKAVSPNSPEAAKEVNNDINRTVATKIHGKWCCKACTYENWPKSQKCIICGTSRGKVFPEGTSACGGSNILENEMSKKGSKKSPPLAIRNAENLEIQQQDGAAASPSNRDDGNQREERRMKVLRTRLRENDWLWLNACHGVVAGDPHAVEAYLTSGGDPARQLTQDEVTLLNRASAFEIGHTLVHLAIRFQREDMLAVLLTATDVAAKATKRLPSHVSPDIAADIKREISSSLRQRKGDFPCFFVTDVVTFALPTDIEDLPPPIQKQLFDELLDRDVQNELEAEESIINWSVEITDRLGSRLYSLWNRTAGDCLLDSVLQATWSVFDLDHSLRRALADSLNEGALTFYPRWKEYESMQAQSLQFSLDEEQWQQDWAVLLSLASQPGAALEQTHIFALSHILRRPIIVYGVKYVKSFRGETIGFARFQGVYLPLLWEKSFCWKTPIALGYTRGHFSALVPMEMDNDDTIGAGANIESNEDSQIAYLPLVDNEGKLLPVHFLTRSEVGKEESLMREWMECLVTKGGIMVAVQKLGKRPVFVRQMLDEWLDRYRQLAQLQEGHQSATAHPTQTFSSDGETDDE